MLLKFYSTKVELFKPESIKSIFKILNDLVVLEYADFKIPGRVEKDDLNLNFTEVINNDWEEKFIENFMISFSSKSSFGGFESHKHYVSFQLYINNDDLSNIIEKLCINLINNIDVDLLFCYENNISPNNFDISYGSHDRGIGIKAGLRDVYWLNYYGESFAQLIGINKLLALPVFSVEPIECGVFFKITENTEDAYSYRPTIKAQIGENFFVPKDIDGKTHMSKTKEKSGLFGLFSHMLHLSRAPENTLVAESRPDFEN